MSKDKKDNQKPLVEQDDLKQDETQDSESTKQTATDDQVATISADSQEDQQVALDDPAIEDAHAEDTEEKPEAVAEAKPDEKVEAKSEMEVEEKPEKAAEAKPDVEGEAKPAKSKAKTDQKDEQDSKPVDVDEDKVVVKSHLSGDSAQKQTGERGWYVIHTYAGYEEQVAENLRQRIDTLKMNDKIFDVIVPKEKQIEIKNGKRKIVEKRIFPGYVIVDMIVTDYSWYVVRNTPNVTGFIGLGVRPTPMLQDEIDRIKKRMGVEEPKYKVNLVIDDLVRISDGPLKGFEGKITEVDEAKGKIKVAVNMFGRETPVNLDFLQVKKV